jgi:hypothetical protein
MLAPLTNRLRIFAGRLRRHFIHQVVGQPDSGAAFGLVGNRHVRPHFSRIYLGDRDATQVRAHFNPGSCTRFVRDTARRHGLCVVCEIAIPRALEPELLRLPRFVSLVTPADRAPDELAKHLPNSARSDVVKVRKHGFTSRVTRDIAWVPEFFTRYHQPSITARHGEEGYVMSIADIERDMREKPCEFLQVMDGSECLAAILCLPCPEGYRMNRLGWREGDPALVKRGALAALYWFSIVRAHELGLQWLRMGGTPPYLEDGVFRFKSKWGARLSRSDTWFGDWHLALNPAHPDCRRLFADRSIVGYGAGDSFIVLSAKAPAEVDMQPAIAAGIRSWYRLRTEPDPEGGAGNTDLPVALRPWFAIEQIPSAH